MSIGNRNRRVRLPATTNDCQKNSKKRILSPNTQKIITPLKMKRHTDLEETRFQTAMIPSWAVWEFMGHLGLEKKDKFSLHSMHHPMRYPSHPLIRGRSARFQEWSRSEKPHDVFIATAQISLAMQQKDSLSLTSSHLRGRFDPRIATTFWVQSATEA